MDFEQDFNPLNLPPKPSYMAKMRLNIKRALFQEADENIDSPTIQTPELVEKNMMASIQKYKTQSLFSQPQYSKHLKDFFSEFSLKEKLGEGTSGVVKRCLRRKDHKAFAVKIIKIVDEEIAIRVVEEFRNLKTIKHPNIVQVYQLFIDSDHGKMYYVMEYVAAKEMIEVLKELNQYSEIIAAKIFKQILSAIEYLHSKGICHRDLKPSNILCDQGNLVKITDFNISKFTDKRFNDYFNFNEKDHKMWTNTGTVQYMAPEVFKNEYNYQVDIWSAGVVLYLMLSGCHPFNAEYVEDLIEIISKGKPEFKEEAWEIVSSKAQDLVIQCLTLEPTIRITASRALEHPWILKFDKNIHKSPKFLPKTTVMNLEQCFKSAKRNRFSKKNFTISSPKKMDGETLEFKFKIEKGEESDGSPRLKKNISNFETLDL